MRALRAGTRRKLGLAVNIASSRRHGRTTLFLPAHAQLPKPILPQQFILESNIMGPGNSFGASLRHRRVANDFGNAATPAQVSSAAVADFTPSDGRLPTHPHAMNALYFMYLCACLVERTWRFALPLCLALVEGGYQAIAVLGFVSPLACSLLGPAAGRLLDRMYRPYGLSLMVALQGVAIVASGLVVLAAAANPAVRFVDGPLFIALLILSMLERLTAICAELAIERDWVTQLSGKDNALALATSNAMLRRTDLSCELVGSLAFGWLYTTAGMAVSVAAATFLAALLLPAQLYSIFSVRHKPLRELFYSKFPLLTMMIAPLSFLG